MNQNQTNMLPSADRESDGQSNNNLYQGPAETGFSGDNIANGFGIGRPATLKNAIETFPGSEASEFAKLKEREIVRFNDLSSKAFGLQVPITNAGIVLDSFASTGYGEGGSKPDVQGGANK